MKAFETQAVLQMIDSLEVGGAERMAVNVANGLAEEGYSSFLCATRRAGPLEESVHQRVGFICLRRKSTLDFKALWKLVRFIREKRISIIHAHSSSLLIGAVAKLLSPGVRLVWHDHYGNHHAQERSRLLYGLLCRFADGIIAVSRPLEKWLVEGLGLRRESVRYLTNFATLHSTSEGCPELPGKDEARVVCLANFRDQKDHRNLIQAFAEVVNEIPTAHLLLIGDTSDEAILSEIIAQITLSGLSANVSILGRRDDSANLLRRSDIGVLSSKSEGLPLALLEYGLSGLAVVVTEVGECNEVLDGGRFGVIVPPQSPGALAEGIIGLLKNTELRARLGSDFKARIEESYSREAALRNLCSFYEYVLGR